MPKPKRKLTPAQKAEKARLRAQYTMIFINGRQKRVRRDDLVEGFPPEEFRRLSADPIWLHHNGLWEYMPEFSEPPPNRGKAGNS